MGYGLTPVTAPVEEPVTSTEMIDHLRLPADTTEGDFLDGLVTAAREVVEGRTNRALCTQTWALSLDSFPGWDGTICVPKPPLQSITSITYVDVDGVTQTLATSDYLVDATQLQSRITPAYGLSWPATREQMGAVTVTFIAGYGDAAAVPQGIKAAMKLLVGNWYRNREATISGTIIAEVPLAVDALLNPHRVVEVA